MNDTSLKDSEHIHFTINPAKNMIKIHSQTDNKIISTTSDNSILEASLNAEINERHRQIRAVYRKNDSDVGSHNNFSGDTIDTIVVSIVEVYRRAAVCRIINKPCLVGSEPSRMLI